MQYPIAPLNINQTAGILEANDPPLWVACKTRLPVDFDRSSIFGALGKPKCGSAPISSFNETGANTLDTRKRLLPPRLKNRERDASYQHHWLPANQPAISFSMYAAKNAIPEIANMLSRTINKMAPVPVPSRKSFTRCWPGSEFNNGALKCSLSSSS